jgi:capsular exopolysaccharide synthesis family protein
MSHPPSMQADGEGAPLDVMRLLNDLRRRWWLIAICTVAMGAAAWYHTRRAPRVFSAKAVVQLVDRRDALAGDLVRGGATARTSAAFSMLSQVEIIRSGGVASQVIKSEPLGLRVNAVGFPSAYMSKVSVDESAAAVRMPLKFTARGVVVSPGGQPVPYGHEVSSGGVRFTIVTRPPEISEGFVAVLSQDRALSRFRSALHVEARERTNLIDITYAAADAGTAQRVVNRVAQVYQSVNIGVAQQQLRRRRLFIEEQLTRTDAQLGEADRALSTFRSQQEAYTSQDKFRAQQAALADLDIRRQELDGERRMARALLRRFETGDDAARRKALSMLAAAPDVGGTRSMVPGLYGRLREYQRVRAELTSGPSGKTDSHPEVQRLDTLMASTQTELMAAAQAHLALLDARIEALDEARRQDATALQHLPAAEAVQTRLQQNFDVLRGQAANLRMEYQQAQVAEAAELGQVDIVDLATGSSFTQSSGTRYILFALFLGLLGGSVIALLLERADRTVKRRDDLESSLGVPVLGTIPRIDPNELERWRFPAVTGLTRAFGRNGSSRGNGASLRAASVKSAARRPTPTSRRRSVALTALAQSRAPGAEAFRHLGANLFYSRSGETARRILVTSPTEGDGKTSIAANLAITLANQRRSVLLIDCDISGKLHNIFQLPASPGLTEVIVDGHSPREVLRPTGVAGLTVITSGSPSERATDVIGSARMRAMLNDMAHDFDIVVLDCSPILALADSTILSVNADAVLLVVRAGHTAAAAAVEAMRHLRTVGAPVAGAVLNDPDDRARQYGSPDYRYAYASAGR